MRNLKKILALVLALIMSLSLMATAGATDFTDDADITADFSESVDVLAGLKVFGGYGDNSFQPQGEITRAEVAAIIYRIVTGQVGDNKNYLVYADYNTFDDVKAEDWFAGYVNFCANAEYVKGVGYAANGKAKFDPQGKVTGYQALAMILRAVGYDKNGEFTGANWQVQTAATAQQLHITDKISSGTLGGAATRETVAEILCKAILVPTVKYTPAFGYRDYESDPNVKNVNLAKSTFQMERLEGIVMANEYADLESDTTLKDGKTRILVGDKAYTMNVTTDLTDIGESRYVYVTPTSNNDWNLVVSEMYDTGKNVTNDNTTLELSSPNDTVKALADAKSIKTVDETEYYVNFDLDDSNWTSDWRIAYVIPQGSTARDEYLAQVLADKGTVEVRKVEFNENGVKVDKAATPGYRRWIAPGENIEPIDQEIIEIIFARASLNANNGTNTNTGVATLNGVSYDIIVDGEVYVATQSKTDISDTLSLKQFKDQYIKTDLTKYTDAANGSWLKVIDNDNDGIVDYVFKTNCTLEQIVDSSTAKDETTYYYGTKLTASPIYLKADSMEVDDEVKFEVGKVIVTATIDGKVYAREAASETAVINTVSYKNETATSTDGTTYYQSGIKNNTDMDERITAMNEKTTYTLYKDFFGYVRAYTGPGNAYGLLTEVYPQGRYNGQLVQNRILTAELTTAEDNGTVKEYTVLNSYNQGWNPFYNDVDDARAFESVNLYGNNEHYDYGNWLTRATDALDVYANAIKSGTYDADSTKEGMNLPRNNPDVFTYNDTIKTQRTWTNVAKYSKTDDGVNLYTASEYMYNKAGDQLYYKSLFNADGVRERLTEAEWKAEWKKLNNSTSDSAAYSAFVNALETGELLYAYAEDYVQLKVGNIAAGQKHWTIHEDYNNVRTSNTYVDATVATEFYVVTRNANGVGRVQHFTGIGSLPAYTTEKNGIHAIYAVAKNTSSDADKVDYWVADVIVIELESQTSAWTSVSLAYFNDRKTSDQVRYVQTLNNKADGIAEELLPTAETWPGQWSSRNYDFYGLANETKNSDGTKSADIHKLSETVESIHTFVDNAVAPDYLTESAVASMAGKDYQYNANGVYAGTVRRTNGLRTYIDVNKQLNNTNVTDAQNISLDISGVPIYSINATSATRQFWTSNVNPVGHQIIWVQNGGSVAFIVDLSYDNTPAWLTDSSETNGYNGTLASVFGRIIFDQRYKDGEKEAEKETLTVNFFNKKQPIVVGTDLTTNITVSYPDAKAFTGDKLTVKNSKGENVKAETLSQITVPAVDDDVKANGWKGTLTISAGGKLHTVNLEILKAAPATELKLKDTTKDAALFADGKLVPPVTKPITIKEFVEKFAIDGTDGEVKWTVTINGKEYTFTGFDADVVEALKNRETDAIETITAEVYAIKGDADPVETYFNAAATLPAKKALAKKQAANEAKWEDSMKDDKDLKDLYDALMDAIDALDTEAEVDDWENQSACSDALTALKNAIEATKKVTINLATLNGVTVTYGKGTYSSGNIVAPAGESVKLTFNGTTGTYLLTLTSDKEGVNPVTETLEFKTGATEIPMNFDLSAGTWTMTIATKITAPKLTFSFTGTDVAVSSTELGNVATNATYDLANGEKVNFTVTSTDSTKIVDSVTANVVDCIVKNADGSYTFTMPNQANVTITVTTATKTEAAEAKQDAANVVAALDNVSFTSLGASAANARNALAALKKAETPAEITEAKEDLADAMGVDEIHLASEYVKDNTADEPGIANSIVIGMNVTSGTVDSVKLFGTVESDKVFNAATDNELAEGVLQGVWPAKTGAPNSDDFWKYTEDDVEKEYATLFEAISAAISGEKMWDFTPDTNADSKNDWAGKTVTGFTYVPVPRTFDSEGNATRISVLLIWKDDAGNYYRDMKTAWDGLVLGYDITWGN